MLIGLFILSPVLFLMKVGFISNHSAKQILVNWFFKNEKLDMFDQKCSSFCRVILPLTIRKGAIDALTQYQSEDATICVVSASLENWVEPWCKNLGIKCL